MKSTLATDPLFRHLIGFDHIQRQVREAASQKYPPFNIEQIEGDDANEIQITLAVAGFSKDELDIELHNQKLNISGKKAETEQDENRHFVHKGISNRSFRQSFLLHEYLEIQSVNLDAGLLTITLKEVVPEEKRPKKIAIQ